MYDNYRFYVMKRIEDNSIKRANGCIDYAGGELKHKYGLVSITINGKRKSVPAHRAYYMAVNNCFDLPSSVYIRHKCDNTCCVNIEHLERGTSKDNTHDCVLRGRKAKRITLHTRQRLLTDAQIIDIRDGSEKASYYCWKYAVSQGYVSKIRNRRAKTLL